MGVGPVKDSLCFKLHLATRVMTGLYKSFLEKLNLTFPQFLVLGILWERDHQTIKSLGEYLYLDSGTLTPLVKRLESAGFVIRKKSDKDERSNIISLTKKGHSLKAVGISTGEEFYQNLMLKEKEISTLTTILDGWITKQLSNETLKTN
jgi:DNA-binding MarR family transcriptional regulator